MNKTNNTQNTENNNKTLSNSIFITDINVLSANSWDILVNKNKVKNKEFNNINNTNRKYKVNYHFKRCSGVSKGLNIKYFLFKWFKQMKGGLKK